MSAYISKRIESRASERYLHTQVHRSMIHNIQEVETTQMPINRQMEKENNGVYPGYVSRIHNGIFFRHKKKSCHMLPHG